jgi:hypothetical protein
LNRDGKIELNLKDQDTIDAIYYLEFMNKKRSKKKKKP